MGEVTTYLGIGLVALAILIGIGYPFFDREKDNQEFKACLQLEGDVKRGYNGSVICTLPKGSK